MDEYLTTAEIAATLKVHPETVKNWLRSGALKGFVLSDRAGWRIRESDLAAFIREREERGPIVGTTDPPAPPEDQ